MFIWVLLHKDNKLLSIYRNTKSQGNFIVWHGCCTGVTPMSFFWGNNNLFDIFELLLPAYCFILLILHLIILQFVSFPKSICSEQGCGTCQWYDLININAAIMDVLCANMLELELNLIVLTV